MANTNMYYEDNSDLAHKKQELRVMLLGLLFHFETDSGVFSRTAIDYGSRALIDAFEPWGTTLLDIGCGYGVLGLTLAKRYELTATLCDVNTRALELTQKNSFLNDISAEIILSDRYSALADKQFDTIVSNPPIRAGKVVVHAILAGAYEHLNDDGQLVVVIQKKQGAASAQKKMEEVFGNCVVVARNKGYYVLQSKKVINKPYFR